MGTIKTNSSCWFDIKKVMNPPIGTKVDFMTKYGHFYYGEIINRHSVGVFYVDGFGYFEDSIVEKWKYSKQ